jgi:predicted DNA-binding transcriptional regulator YafY
MNRIDRLNAILIQLQSKRIVKAHEIAGRFDISLRTVYRDIRALEEAGIPIGAEAGVGYYLMENFHLPPVMFTHDEAAALLFGEKLIEKMSDEKVKTDFCSALYKIKAILKPGEKDHLEKLYDRITVFNWNGRDAACNYLYLYEIQQALANKQMLTIEYESKYAEEKTCRTVEPIGLCNYSQRWHLIAWCKLRSDYRDFRLDRIVSLKLIDKFFTEKQHPSVEEYLRLVNPVATEATISILVPKERAKYLDDSKYWYGFVGQEDLGEYVRMQFANDELHGFAVWMLNTGSLAKVERPAELTAILQSFIKQVVSNYQELL